MTTVNVTTAESKVLVTTPDGTTVVQAPVTTTVTATTAGPQGPKGDTGDAGLVLDSSSKVEGSVIYYDATANTFRADTTWTTDTLADGGNF